MAEEDAKQTVLDHIDRIVVPGDVFQQPANEYWALICLWNGMEFLYRQASRCSEEVTQRVNSQGKHRVFMSGNISGLDSIAQSLLTCGFHWYAVTACNYARLVGAIGYRQDNTRPIPPKYVQHVIPEVLAFRDKVAAHFAWSTEHSKDNDAERLFSIFPPLTFDDDSFFVGGLGVYVRRFGKSSNSKAILPWSIVRVHERLRARYWPAPTGTTPNANAI